jgi:hypothetical protein
LKGGIIDGKTQSPEKTGCQEEEKSSTKEEESSEEKKALKIRSADF